MDSIYEIINAVVDTEPDLLGSDWEVYELDGKVWGGNPEWDAYDLTVNLRICKEGEWQKVFGNLLEYIPCNEEESGFTFNAEVDLQ